MMKIIKQALALMLPLVSINAYAQFTNVWSSAYQHTTSSGYSNEGRKIAEDPTGNIFILSDNTSDIDPNGVQSTATFHYVVVAKYSTNGALLNSLVIEVYNHVTAGNDNPGAFGLEVDAAGDVYVGYTTYDAITGYDVALGKYDNNLVRLWTNLFSTNADEEGIDFKLDASGSIYAVVRSSGAQDIYSLIRSVPFSAPADLVYDYPANTVVIKSFDLDGNQTAYIGGYVSKSGHKNAYVGAIDVVNGNVLWGTYYTPRGIIGDDVVNQVTVGVDGNIYTAGTSFQGINGDRVLVTKNLPGTPRFDFVALLKGNTINTGGYFINASESGWLYIGAASINDSYAYVFRIPDDGIFNFPGMIQFSPEPTVPYTTINGITLNAMKISLSKSIYITGGIHATGPTGDFNCSYLFKSRVVFGNALIDDGGMNVDGQVGANYEGIGLTLDYSKTDVYWLRNTWDANHTSEAEELIDISVPSPFKDAGQDDETISISPNPATTTIEVSFNNIIKDVEVLDITGSRVLYSPAGFMTTRLDVSSLAQGYYLLKSNTGAGQKMKVLIID